MQRGIYLDYNATTPIAPEVREAMLPFLEQQYGNPSSGHALGRAGREAVDDARVRVAEFLGAQPDEILFTSGGTESNNLAIKGCAWSPRFRESGHLGSGRLGSGHLVVSSLEHPAVVEPARFLERHGYRLSIVAADDFGLIDPAAVEGALVDDTLLVSIMHANNEIGTVEPIAEIAGRCRSRGVLVHTDAAQSAGKINLQVDELGIDLLTLAGHKMYAPKGIGALYVRRGTQLEPLLHGAGHERGLRSGTENVAFIVGLGRAATMARESQHDASGRMARLRDRLFEQLKQAIGPELTLNGHPTRRLPNTLSVNFPGVVAGEMLRRVPELYASTGAACHSGSTHLSATLAAIGLDPTIARGTMRLSVGRYTTDDEIEQAARLLVAAWMDSR